MLPEEPLLVAPVGRPILQHAVEGTVISGDQALLDREVMGVLVAGMTAEHVLERLTEGVAVITPGDRSDVVLAVVSAHAAEGFPSLSCIILNGGLPLHPSIAALVYGPGPAAADHRHRPSAPSRRRARSRRPAAGSPRPRSARSTPRSR